jgi:hypothetical protein
VSIVAVAFITSACRPAPTFSLAAQHDGVNVEKYQLLVDGTVEQEIAGPRKELRFTTRVPAKCTQYTVTAVNAAGSSSTAIVLCPEYGGQHVVVKGQAGSGTPPAREP